MESTTVDTAADTAPDSASDTAPEDASVPMPVEAFATEPTKAAQEDGEQTKDENAEEAGTELTVEELAKLDHDKKKQRREEKRQADAKLRKHFKEPEPERKTKPEPEPELEPEAERLSDIETEMGAEDEPKAKRKTVSILRAEGSLHSEVEATRMRSSMLLSGSYDMQVMEEVKTEEASSSDEEEHGRRACSVSFKTDFLNNFNFPSMSDISTESSDIILESLRATLDQRFSSIRDEGKFVDPLTGVTISSASSEEPAKEEGEEEDKSSSSTVSFEWPFDLEDKFVPAVVHKVDDTEMAMEMLFEVHSAMRIVSAESTTAMELERTQRENRQIVIDFLYKTIDDAVEAAEYVDPDSILRAKMDKVKLIEDLHRVISNCIFAKQYNKDLTNKMFEYYRRVGQLRVFDRLPEEVEETEFRRHREALLHLDHLKQKATETKRVNNLLMASVAMDLTYVSKISTSTVESLEKCFRETLIRKDAQIMPRIVENELRRMQIMRNEISDSRLYLITRQHTLGRLIERKRNFDQITEDLTMDQFLNAQRDVAALGTKVEERSYELKRMHDRCTKHVHQLAFIREKTSMISATLDQHKIDFKKKVNRQNELRDQLLKLKLQHARLKSQKFELHEKNGLLYKPALLHDYDATLEICEAKREIVKGLRNTVQDLEARIAIFETHARDSITVQAMPRRTITSLKR